MLQCSTAFAEEDKRSDGELFFSSQGFSDIEFVFGNQMGKVSKTELTYNGGQPFTYSKGTCQVSVVLNAYELQRYALGVSADGQWVANIAPVFKISADETPDVPVLGVQCYLR